jgi:hypothetical protein
MTIWAGDRVAAAGQARPPAANPTRAIVFNTFMDELPLSSWLAAKSDKPTKNSNGTQLRRLLYHELPVNGGLRDTG